MTGAAASNPGTAECPRGGGLVGLMGIPIFRALPFWRPWLRRCAESLSFAQHINPLSVAVE
jgi:hypothetical protein